MTNLDGRVTLWEASYPILGEAKHDWQIICDITYILGKGNYLSYSSAEEILLLIFKRKHDYVACPKKYKAMY